MGVLPDPLKSYTGSVPDLIYRSVIILPLDTLGVLPVLLFLGSGSTPSTFILGFREYSWHNIWVVIILPVILFLVSGSTPSVLIFGLREYSQYSYFWVLGVLPVLLFLVSGSTPNIINEFLYYSQLFYFLSLGVLPVCLLPEAKKSILGVLPETQNKRTGSTPRDLK